MQGSILPVTMPPPGHTPGICNFFHTWRSIPHPRARRKRQFPTPGTPHRPQIKTNREYDNSVINARESLTHNAVQIIITAISP